MKMYYLILTGTLLLGACARTAALPLETQGLNERWLELAKQHPELLISDYGLLPWAVRNHCPEAGPILEAYYDATVMEPRRRGELWLRLLDEQGRPLEGVKLEIRAVWAPHPLALEPVMRTEKRIVNGETRIAWTKAHSSLEIDLSKAGYRTIEISFTPSPNDQLDRFRYAREGLEAGLVCVPEAPGGPVRVVMPPEVEWGEPGVQSLVPTDRKTWPRRIHGNERIMVDTSAPKNIIAPVRGTYVVADREGKVVLLVRADPGNALGLLRLDDDLRPGTKFVQFEYRGNTKPLESSGEPYTLRLWREAKPIRPVPTTQPSP